MNKVLTHRVAGKEFRTEEEALLEFWRRMSVTMRVKTPQELIVIDKVDFDKTMGWEITYVADVEDLPKTVEPKNQSKLISANLAVPEPVQAQPDDGHEREVLVSSIMITGWNPRKRFDEEAIKSLAESIAVEGLHQAILVRPKGDKRYELIFGERRLRAIKSLGRKTIRARVEEHTDEEVLDIMMSENLQRVQLNPIEEAHHIKRILEVGKITQTELGRRIGKGMSQEWVSQRLRLAEAPAVLQELIICRQINLTSAIELLGWKDTDHWDELITRVGDECADSPEGEEIPRARVREIIKEVTEPEPVRYSSNTIEASGDPKLATEDEYQRFVAEVTEHIRPSGAIDPEPEPITDTSKELSGTNDTAPAEPELPWLQQPVVINDEECGECVHYVGGAKECSEGCRTNEDCGNTFDDGLDNKPEAQDEIVPAEDEKDERPAPEKTKFTKEQDEAAGQKKVKLLSGMAHSGWLPNEEQLETIGEVIQKLRSAKDLFDKKDKLGGFKVLKVAQDALNKVCEEVLP